MTSRENKNKQTNKQTTAAYLHEDLNLALEDRGASDGMEVL